MSTSPSIVPRGDGDTVILVLDHLGHHGEVWRETPAGIDLELVIADLLEGQYHNPVRVAAFNTTEGWSRDVSENVAREVRRLSDLRGIELSPGVEEFVMRHDGRGPAAADAAIDLSHEAAEEAEDAATDTAHGGHPASD